MWQCRHPSDIDRDEWLLWLDQMPDASPYLLPEWPLFWERVWPSARAEFWVRAGEIEIPGGVPVVRRRRWGLEWVFSQPYGTPGGWIGWPKTELGDDSLRSIISRRTVEIAMSSPARCETPKRWISRTITSSAWVLDRGDAPPSAILGELSDSHRRNVEKGSQLTPAISELTTDAAVQLMQRDFPHSSGRSSRLVLDSRRGPAFASIFAPTGALRWWAARVGGRCVATCVWLVFRRSAVYVDGASLRSDEYTGVNHHMFAELLMSLSHAGVCRFDFGAGPGGTSEPGLSRFKEGWGARPVERSEVLLRRAWYVQLKRLRD